jgi:hypothetical protein
MSHPDNAKFAAAIESHLFNVKCQQHNAKICKVNLYPNADHFFLCVDCIVDLAEFNKKYQPYYLPLTEFVVQLTGGQLSMGDDMTDKLKAKNEKLQDVKQEYIDRLEMEDTIIDEDMDN